MLTQHNSKPWFFEELYPNHAFGFEVSEVLVPEYDTGFQRLLVVDTPAFGKVMVLDNIVQLAEFDEYFYHESMTHTALYAHKNPKKVLIIGGGDCGIAREVLKHRSVESVTIVDIDPEVTKVAGKHFPTLTSGVIDDPRLTILHEDATNIDTLFPNVSFDVIMMDTTDNVGAAVPLFQGAFTRKVYELLSDDGILIRLGGSVLLQQEELREVTDDTVRIFGNDRVLHVTFSGVATYYGGPFSLVIAGKIGAPVPKYEGREMVRARWYSEVSHQRMLSTIERYSDHE